MKSYIHLYKTNSDFTASYNGPDYKEPWLSLTEEGMKVNYNKPKLTAITFDNITWVTDVPATGGTATKDNCTFEVNGIYDNGTSVDISSDVTVTGELAVPSSTAEQRHEAGQLTLTASYGEFTATGNVTVYQAADFSTKPLTFKISSPGTINWAASNRYLTKTIEYKLNNGEWTSITSNMEGVKITVNADDKIQFRGNNAAYSTSSSYYSTFKGSTAGLEIEGNIMSLINPTDFSILTTLESNFTFNNLFKGCTGLTSTKNLILPATTLTQYCYSGMFYGCTSLTTVPSNLLPATTLANGCYYEMFYGCTSLTIPPELPAMTLASNCYQYMFYGCRSLTTAPELPANTLADSCYDGMFYGCTSLTTAPKKLPATTLADSCYSNMFQDCTNLLIPPELPAMTLASSCYSSMFDGCTSLTTAPQLPATTLANYCYSHMFNGCTSLATVPSNLLPATKLADYCYYYMFYGCTSLATVPSNLLPATTLANNCYSMMFQGSASLTTAPELPATTLADSCYSTMFDGCTSLTTAPQLPATTLANYCYSYMFNGCTKLNYIKCLAIDISASYCTNTWVDGVASNGTFVKASSMTSWKTGTSGIPSGWTVQNA